MCYCHVCLQLGCCYVCDCLLLSIRLNLDRAQGCILGYGLVIRHHYGLNLNIRPVNCECVRLCNQDQDDVLGHNVGLGMVLVRVPVCRDSTDGMDSMVQVCASMGHTMDHTKGHTTMICTKVCTIRPSPS